MLDRRGSIVGGEVVDGVRRQVPVLDVQDAGTHVGEEPLPVADRDQHGRGRDAGGDDEERRRQQAAGATGPEGGQRHGSGAVELAQQQVRDEEAGDREEHVDADETARDT